MRKYTRAAAILAVSIAALFPLSGCDNKALNVNEIAGDPSAFGGSITITGITAGISPQDPSIFGIMDIKELQCTTKNCNKVIIPVSCKGTTPRPGDEVRIVGSFVTKGGGYLFAAEKVTVVRHHKIGG